MKPRLLIGAALLATLSALPAVARAQDVPAVPAHTTSGDTKWVVDMVHSQVAFGVRHLVGQVRGTFDRWYATITTKGGDWKTGTATVKVETASLNTGNRFRDADLRSDRFFASERFPQMTFEGAGFAVSDSTMDLNGILTIRGKSRPVTLTGRYRGAMKGADGKERIGFEATGTVDRRHFDIDWNESIGGTELIGNNVEITIGIEAVRVN
jgi:polyisoprenoid-binding protein YceI